MPCDKDQRGSPHAAADVHGSHHRYGMPDILQGLTAALGAFLPGLAGSSCYCSWPTVWPESSPCLPVGSLGRDVWINGPECWDYRAIRGRHLATTWAYSASSSPMTACTLVMCQWVWSSRAIRQTAAEARPRPSLWPGRHVDHTGGWFGPNYGPRSSTPSQYRPGGQAAS